MIKLLAVGLWACVVALGASWATASFTGAQAAPEEQEATYFQGLDYRKTNNITVPLIGEDAIKGYLLANFVYTIDGAKAAKLAVPPDPFILDEAFRRLYSIEGFDFDNPRRYDIDSLTTEIKDAVNERYGEALVHEVLVEQFDFIARESIRNGFPDKAS